MDMGGFCNTYIVIRMPLKHSRNCYHSHSYNPIWFPKSHCSSPYVLSSE